MYERLNMNNTGRMSGTLHNQKAIAFFDSGVGGLTVLSQALRVMPDERYIYYADNNNVPYGTKPREEVKELVMRAVDFLASKDIKALVVACNTATSIAVNSLREKFDFPIIGMEPAVKPAVVNNNSGKRVLVLATPLTLAEDKFHNLVSRLDADQVVDMIPMPKLVTYAESLKHYDDSVKNYIKFQLSLCDIYRYSTIVLGCTHFIYFKKCISELVPKDIQIIDGNNGTVKHLMKTLDSLGLRNNDGKGIKEYYISGKIASIEEINIFEYLISNIT